MDQAIADNKNMNNEKFTQKSSNGLELHRHALDEMAQVNLRDVIRKIAKHAPFYPPIMPKSGKKMSVKITGCGTYGWTTDQQNGYRYDKIHPVTNLALPPIPEILQDIWANYAEDFPMVDSCLINFYDQTAKMGSHRDMDEHHKTAPVISISLGDDAVFHLGGAKRNDPKTRMIVKSGDIIVMGGASRDFYHGIDKINFGSSKLLSKGGRLNLTLRRVML